MYEPVPLPGLTLRSGRMSFGPSISNTETRVDSAHPVAGVPVALVGGAAASEQPSVSDAEMVKAFKKPAEMRSWQPSSLRIHDAAGASKTAESGGVERIGSVPRSAADTAGGSTRAPGCNVGKLQSGNLPAAGNKKPSGTGVSQASTHSKNSFAPLRPPKRSKTQPA